MIRSSRLRIFGILAALTLPLAMLAPARAGIIVLNVVNSNGYRFVNFDGPTPNTAGTTINGISNNGTVVGFTTADNMNFNNFTANPLTSTNSTAINVNNSTTAMANGINSAGTIVGTDGNNNAFIQNGNTTTIYQPPGAVAAIAFGINDKGAVAGQYTTNADTSPGFVLDQNKVLTTINAPAGPNVVNAQGINNNGLVAGFYLGTDGQVHGFTFDSKTAVNNVGVGTAIADPTIPRVAGEPGATFVFSQMLGINDNGIISGYYGDSTLSQHGYLYNTTTGKYTFLDDPNAAFNNGVEVTQITGINNSGEIAGFYTDAAGLAHGFIATPLASVPEPGSVILLAVSLGVAGGTMHLRRRRSVKVVA
jgi:hypothetical protein